MFSQYENSHHFIIDSSNKNSQKATVKMYSFSLLFFWKTSPRRELKLCRAPTVRQWAETLVCSCIYTRRQCVFPFRLMSSLRIGCDSRILHSPHMPANDQAKLWLKKKQKRERTSSIFGCFELPCSYATTTHTENTACEFARECIWRPRTLAAAMSFGNRNWVQCPVECIFTRRTCVRK